MPLPLVIASVACAALAAQAPSPAWLKAPARVSAAASIGASPQAPGTSFVVLVDVTPAPGIHVYAPGNDGYIPVALAAEPTSGVTVGTPTFPAAEPLVFGELKETVQAYSKPFRIRLPIAVVNGPTRPKAVALSLRYQACTDKVCYPPATLALEVSVPPAVR